MFSGLSFCISGTLSIGRKQMEGIITKNKGQVASTLTKKVTHLITNEEEFAAGKNKKIVQAQDSGVSIVDENFVHDSLSNKKLEKEIDHSFDNPSKKKKKMVNYEGLIFILHPKIASQYTDFIVERGGKIVTSFEQVSKEDLWKLKTKIVCNIENFNDFYGIVQKMNQAKEEQDEKENEKMEKMREEAGRLGIPEEKSEESPVEEDEISQDDENEDDDIGSIDDEEIKSLRNLDEDRFALQLVSPKFLTDVDENGQEVDLDSFESDCVLYSKFHNCAYRVFPGMKDREMVEKIIIDGGGRIHDSEAHTPFLIDRQDLNKIDKECFKTYKPWRFIVLLEDVVKQNQLVCCEGTPFIPFHTANELGLDFSNFDEFSNIIIRRKDHKMDNIDGLGSIAKSSTYDGIVPLEVLSHIFSYLPLKDHVATRLLSKDFVQNSSDYWRAVCTSTITETSWMTKVPVDKLNPCKKHWYQFYREYLHPLLMDQKILEDYMKKQLPKGVTWPNEWKDEELKSIYKPGIFWDTKPSQTVPIGGSKFGGMPDLPKSLKWPQGMSFIGQINTLDDEYKQCLTASFYDLPEGILYFFCETEDAMETGKVLFYGGKTSDLTRLKDYPKWFEDSGNQKFDTCVQIRPFEALTVIKSDDVSKKFGDDADGFELYENPHLPAEGRSGNSVLYHSMFGNDMQVQDSVLENDETVLLLQVDSDDKWDACWGDLGCLYYTMSKSDLLKAKKDPKVFENAKLEMQCS